LEALLVGNLESFFGRGTAAATADICRCLWSINRTYTPSVLLLQQKAVVRVVFARQMSHCSLFGRFLGKALVELGTRPVLESPGLHGVLRCNIHNRIRNSSNDKQLLQWTTQVPKCVLCCSAHLNDVSVHLLLT
jgi:hypothetical protein